MVIQERVDIDIRNNDIDLYIDIDVEETQTSPTARPWSGTIHQLVQLATGKDHLLLAADSRRERVTHNREMRPLGIITSVVFLC